MFLSLRSTDGKKVTPILKNILEQHPHRFRFDFAALIHSC